MRRKLFDEDLKAKLSKSNLGFFAFAIFVLHVADAGLLSLVGASTGSEYTESGMQTFVYFAVMMYILKSYFKYCIKSTKAVCVEAQSTDEVPEQTAEPATKVVDTVQVQGPPRSAWQPKNASWTPKSGKWVPKWLRQAMPRKLNPKAEKFVPSGLNPKAEKFVPAGPSCGLDSAPEWLKTAVRAKELNPKAKKFVPAGPSNTLNSNSPVFVPTAMAEKEQELLKSTCGGDEAGDVVYRSNRWISEICPGTKKASPEHAKKTSVAKDSWKRSKSRSKSPSPELVVKKWQQKVDPKDIKWRSSFNAACMLGA